MLEKIYRFMPRWLQTIGLYFHGYIIQKQRYGAKFKDALNVLENNRFDTKIELSKYHQKLFLALLDNIKKNELSIKRFNFLYGNIDNFKNISDLDNLPTTNKIMIKRALKEFPIGNESDAIISHTSGTTGNGLIFPVSKNAVAYQWAVWWRYRHVHKINFNTICGYFGGRLIVPLKEKNNFYRINKPAKQIMFSAYHLNQKNLYNYIEGIQKYNITWLHGYPSFLSNFAALILENNIDIGKQIKIITIGSESLLAHQKKILENVFSCPVRQHYGLAEGVVNISENSVGKLIIDEDFSICHLEKLSTNGDQYKLIGTSLFNSSMPLLKYDTGDLVRLSNNSTILREIIDIDGRREDAILLPDGTHIGRLDHIFKDITDVQEVQIQQNNTSEIDVHIVRSNSYTKSSEQRIKKEFVNRLGTQLKIHFIYVDSIKKTNTGKLRFVVSKI